MRPTRWTRAGAALAAQGRLLAYGLGELGARPRHAERFSIAYNIRRLPLGGSSLSSLTSCRFHALSLFRYARLGWVWSDAPGGCAVPWPCLWVLFFPR